MEKICKECAKSKKHFALGLCRQCYLIQWTHKKKAHTWNKICTICACSYFNKSLGSRAKYCKPCGIKVSRDNHRKRNRIKNGISLTKPILNKKRNGEGYICPQGYKHITVPGHPNAKNKQGRLCEHTVVMCKFIGRALTKNESVHHKNGIRNDNRIENLEIWHRGQPGGQRLEDKIKWAKEFLKQYGECHCG